MRVRAGRGQGRPRGLGAGGAPRPGQPAHHGRGAFDPILDFAIGERDRPSGEQRGRPAASKTPPSGGAAGAQHIRQSAREAALRARNEMEHRIEMRDWHKFLARTEHANRTADWQQVVESREAESGLEKILAEPPSSEVTDKEGNLLWQSAPPHLTSHWNTISKVNRDPPARQHVKMISAYRKYFPTADKRPPTPRKPVWGGDREHPYVRESLSPRSVCSRATRSASSCCRHVRKHPGLEEHEPPRVRWYGACLRVDARPLSGLWCGWPCSALGSSRRSHVTDQQSSAVWGSERESRKFVCAFGPGRGAWENWATPEPGR